MTRSLLLTALVSISVISSSMAMAQTTAAVSTARTPPCWNHPDLKAPACRDLKDLSAAEQKAYAAATPDTPPVEHDDRLPTEQTKTLNGSPVPQPTDGTIAAPVQGIKQ